MHAVLYSRLKYMFFLQIHVLTSPLRGKHYKLWAQAVRMIGDVEVLSARHCMFVRNSPSRTRQDPKSMIQEESGKLVAMSLVTLYLSASNVEEDTFGQSRFQRSVSQGHSVWQALRCHRQCNGIAS